MPTYTVDIQDKLDDLQALTGAERKPAEIVVIYWPSPTGTKVYSSAMYTELPWWPDLADAIETYFEEVIPITLTLIPDGTPFIDLPRAASVSDDSINLTFSDLDDEFSDLLMDHGEGLRCEVFGYWPAVDLLLSMWRGMLHQPKEMNRDQVKITATSGWRSPNMLVPKRPFATSCPFIFGALLSTQDEIDYHNGCPYNDHIGGDIGVPGFTDCPRRVKADCVERLDTEVYWPGFETREDPIPNNQTSGPNLLAKAIGNESALSDPIRAIAGERYVKALYLLAFRNEVDTNHPEDGFGAALFAVSEGPNLAMWEFRINGQIVGAEHLQLRKGELGQAPTDWSPDVNSYSGTAHGYGRIQGEFDHATAGDYSGSLRVLGARDVRIYSDPDTYVEGYTTNRAWWLLKILAEARWGYGQDYPRFDIQSFIDTAEWCDELVTLTDVNGNTFSGVRSTFNAEVTARAIQQQVKDICTAGRIGIPFEFEGKDVIVPLRAEDVDDLDIPSFTDEGTNRNIIYDGVKSSLSWSVISDESLTNQWTVNFDDAANGGVDTQYIFGDQAQQLRAGRAWGDRSKRVVNKSQAGYGINSGQEAARFGNSLLYLGPLDSGGILNPFSVKFTTWYAEAFNVQNYRLIKVVNTKLQSRMAGYFGTRGLQPYPGADYTCFRVMKYTRKGDLRVEIEAQQYATLDESPFELCGPVGVPAESLDAFVLSKLPTGYWKLHETEFPGPAPNFECIDSSGNDHHGTLQPDFGLVQGILGPVDTEAECFAIAGGIARIPSLGNTTGDLTPTGTQLTIVAFADKSSTGSAVQTIISHGGDTVQTYVAYGQPGTGNFADQVVFSIETTSGVYLLVSQAVTSDEFHRVVCVLDILIGWMAIYIDGCLSSSRMDLDTEAEIDVEDAPWRIGYMANSVFGAINWSSGEDHVSFHPNTWSDQDVSDDWASAKGIGIDLGLFSNPREFTATVNATTGLVHFHWSPPARHPDMVTGYTLFEADGVTVVMPTALVYEFEITLAPGTYTYKLNATDGSVTSGFVSVTFTVPIPPADLTLIDRDTGNTLVDRTSGDILESRTA